MREDGHPVAVDAPHLSAAGRSTTVTIISKTVGGRFGGLEWNDVENAGGNAHFDDNATICPSKDEFEHAYADYYYCRNWIVNGNDDDENDDDENDDGDNGLLGACSEIEQSSRTQPTQSSAQRYTPSSIDRDLSPSQWRIDPRSDSYSDSLSHERCTASMKVSGIHTDKSTSETSNGCEGFGFGTFVHRYFNDLSNKIIVILVALTSIVVLVCVTAIVIDDYNYKKRNSNSSSGKWSTNHALGDYEDSRPWSVSHSHGPSLSSSTMEATSAPFRNIFESKPYSRGSESPAPTISKPEPTIYPSPPNPFALGILPPPPSPLSDPPSRSPTTLLLAPNVSIQPTVSPSLEPNQMHATILPTDNPSTRQSPPPTSNPTSPPR